MGVRTDSIKSRADLYGILVDIMRAEPSESTLAMLSERLSAVKEQTKSWAEPELRQAVKKMLEALDVSPDDLAGDYACLFLAGRDGNKCPSEAAYMENLMFGQATLEVMEVYSHHGFIKDNSFKEPEDHIALECAFMAALSQEFLSVYHKSGVTSSESQKTLQTQKEFLEQHLSRWVPLWSRTVEKSAETGFFKAAALLARTLIEADLRLLAELKESSQAGLGCKET